MVERARKRGSTDGDGKGSEPETQPPDAEGTAGIRPRLVPMTIRRATHRPAPSRTSSSSPAPRRWARAVTAALTAVSFLLPVVLSTTGAAAANGDITTVAGNGTTSPAVVDGNQATSGAIDAPD